MSKMPRNMLHFLLVGILSQVSARLVRRWNPEGLNRFQLPTIFCGGNLPDLLAKSLDS